jgi:UDP-glucose 4-epimerase
MKKLKVLVTGGAGFIGSEIANILGKDCVVVDNLSTGKVSNLENTQHLIKADIRNKSALDSIFKKYKPLYVCHLAAQISAPKSISDPSYDAQVNILGTINILEISKKYACKKIVIASSAAIYGENPNIPLKEIELANPMCPYGISKRVAELYTDYFYKQNSLPYCILRFSNVYGPKQNSEAEGGVIAIFVDRLKKNMDVNVFGNGNQTRDFIFVRDVANACINACNEGNIGIYNISTRKQISINNILKKMRRIQKSKSNIKYLDKRPGDITHSCLDNNKFIRDYHWQPQYDINAGLTTMFSV